jgi:hypothetical protein
MTSIYERLKSDHNKHCALLAQLADTSGDSAMRRELWEAFYY